MYAIVIKGTKTEAEFLLDSRYDTKEEAEKAVAKIADANKSTFTTREVVEVAS